MCNDFLISPGYAVPFEYPFLLCLTSKEEKEKNEGGLKKEGTNSLPSLEFTWTRGRKTFNIGGGGTNNSCSSLCLNFHDEAIRRSNQNTPSTFRVQSPQCLPLLFQIAFKLLQDQVHSCLPWLGFWRGRSCYSANSWNQLKLTEIYCPSLSLEAASFL